MNVIKLKNIKKKFNNARELANLCNNNHEIEYNNDDDDCDDYN